MNRDTSNTVGGIPCGVETVLIRCPNWVGECRYGYSCSGLCQGKFSTCPITGIIGKNAQGIVRDGPWFDDFIDCEDKTSAGMWRMIKKIRALKPDMAILLTNSFRSVLPVWLGKAKNIYGYRRDLRGIFLSRRTEAASQRRQNWCRFLCRSII